MDAVAALDHWAAVADARPENRAVLRLMAPDEFVAVTERWRRAYWSAGSSDDLLGVDDDDLRNLAMPVAIVPYYDRGHPISAWQRAEGLVADVRVFDFDPSRHGDVKRTVDDTDVVARLIAGFIADVASAPVCNASATSAARPPSPRRWWSRRSS
jgi:hypothetical protein